LVREGVSTFAVKMNQEERHDRPVCLVRSPVEMLSHSE